MYFMIADGVVQPNYQKRGIGHKNVSMIIEYVDKTTPVGGRSSIQLIAEKGKGNSHEKNVSIYARYNSNDFFVFLF